MKHAKARPARVGTYGDTRSAERRLKLAAARVNVLTHPRKLPMKRAKPKLYYLLELAHRHEKRRTSYELPTAHD